MSLPSFGDSRPLPLVQSPLTSLCSAKERIRISCGNSYVRYPCGNRLRPVSSPLRSFLAKATSPVTAQVKPAPCSLEHVSRSNCSTSPSSRVRIVKRFLTAFARCRYRFAHFWRRRQVQSLGTRQRAAFPFDRNIHFEPYIFIEYFIEKNSVLPKCPFCATQTATQISGFSETSATQNPCYCWFHSAFSVSHRVPFFHVSFSFVSGLVEVELLSIFVSAY